MGEVKWFRFTPQIIVLRFDKLKKLVYCYPGTDFTTPGEGTISTGIPLLKMLTGGMPGDLGTSNTRSIGGYLNSGTNQDISMISSALDFLEACLAINGKKVAYSLLEQTDMFTRGYAIPNDWEVVHLAHSMGCALAPLTSARVANVLNKVKHHMVLFAPWHSYSPKAGELIQKMLGGPIFNLVNTNDPFSNFSSLVQSAYEYFSSGGKHAMTRSRFPVSPCPLHLVHTPSGYDSRRY